MIILDIDQDYFFLPVFGGKIIESEEERNRIYYRAKFGPKDVVNKFKLEKFKGNISIHNNHDEVYHELKKLGKENKLIHLDAHDDVCHHENLKKLDIGNWITYSILENLIDTNIIWINQLQDNNCVYNYNAFDEEYHLHTSTLNNFYFTKKIDYIFYTRSKEFCPTTKIENEFLNLIS